MESDSDDELMNALNAFGGSVEQQNPCWYCETPNASLQCSMCGLAVYCDSTCLRQDFKTHRPKCITLCMDESEDEEEYDEEYLSDDSGSEDSEDDVRNSKMNKPPKTHSASKLTTSQTISAPGLTEKQLKKLMQLSSRSTDVDKQSQAIHQLEEQIQKLMAQKPSNEGRESNIETSVSRKSFKRESSTGIVKKREIKALQAQLQALERRAAAGGFSTSSSGLPNIYRPLLVKDDEAFKKYFKLKSMDMPADQIKSKMEQDGIDTSLLDTPNAVSPNDPGPPTGSYVPLKIREDPKFRKYFKLKGMNMPVEQIKMKMEVDGVDPHLLDQPDGVSPNDPGPVAHRPPAPAFPMSMPMMNIPASTQANYVPMKIKDDPAYQKYFKLLKLGMDEEHIALKMQTDGVDPSVLKTPDDISPNDKGPPENTANGNTDMASLLSGGGIPGGMSFQQLFSMMMQNMPNMKNGDGINDQMKAFQPPKSIEDQMAEELAQAESALEDIFGEEDTNSGGGGPGWVQQLEKKARKNENIKIVNHRDKINDLINEILDTEFAEEKVAIEFYNRIHAELEECGLCLGVDENQTWSARLLIKNKETRDWYFTESQRLDAGKAYQRLWTLSILSNYINQIQEKHQQILQAPSTLKNTVRSKVDLIDKFIQLLKDSVKLQHKILKSRQFQAETTRMATFNIPQRIVQHTDELKQNSRHLVEASFILAEEEFISLDKTTRAKRLRASIVVQVSAKTLQIGNIGRKLGVMNTSDDERMKNIETQMNEIKEKFMNGDEEEEEEDDVL